MSKFKYLLTGLVLGALLLGAVPVVASQISRTLDVTYRDLKIFVDGSRIQTDHEPFVVDAYATTFVPLRVVSEALGATVGWDDATNSIYLYSAATPPIDFIRPAPEPTAAEEAFIGTWLFMGSPYYVFEPGGRGLIYGMDMRWSTDQGILSICTSPDLCGDNCPSPDEWSYVIDGNRLVLSSYPEEGMSFTYIRR